MRGNLTNQVQIYSVDTSFFYNEEELNIHTQLNERYIKRTDIKKKISAEIKKLKKNPTLSESNKLKIEKELFNLNKEIKALKNELHELFPKNTGIRTFNEDMITAKNEISVFESVLTRTLKMDTDRLSKDIIVIQTYFFNILQDIIKNGFLWNGEKYVVFTASAGQIRTKKTIFIKESQLLKYQKSLMCGLSSDIINQKGGMNINKYLAYLALCNTASEHWDIDISKAIVVDDLETTVECLVDFINDETYEVKREKAGVEISHTDGCGMILPKLSKKSFMCRLPFVKGLLVSFPYDKFIREHNRKNPNDKIGKVKDIYGKEYDILEDDIQIIFTKSQFKMAKYYSSWDEYKENFIKYDCKAGKTNEEEDKFSDAKLNYQMLQSLYKLSHDDLKTISQETVTRIKNIGSDRHAMLKVLGVTDSNQNKNYIQQALELYPELLNDAYCKDILKQVKKSLVRDGRSGKLDIDGKYTFICPDLYAFCEYLFLGHENPKGLLQDGEVYCELYKEKKKLDLLRSPHLYMEHAIRNNVIDKEKKRWFKTKGVYTSVHDVISKILMFDVDGDKSLVCADETLINAAEEHVKEAGVVPLYYNMKKAGESQINGDSIYEGLSAAYTGGNIGAISNDITKIWNSEEVDLNVIKLLCMENNFVIDYAKTLYKPTRPKEVNDLIRSYTKLKTPHFFKYAKDKEDNKVEPLNHSVVNKLEKIVPNPIINFRKAKLGEFDYKMLMSNPDVDINEEIIEKYRILDTKKKFMSSERDKEFENLSALYTNIKKELVNGFNNTYVSDVLTKYLYEVKSSKFKTTLWECFGEELVNNLRSNVKVKLNNTIPCEGCGERIEVINNQSKYCRECWLEKERQRQLKKWHKNKHVYRNATVLEKTL
ncbi:RNA dependent RNA polymerase [Priestia flexa]|uniref:RNA dependent RNA polymerase n=1 Tax=Priestia flexa TaxID=86664 RepID=UPI000473169A|nr:hypothetical protein [Priestia flexa]